MILVYGLTGQNVSLRVTAGAGFDSIHKSFVYSSGYLVSISLYLTCERFFQASPYPDTFLPILAQNRIGFVEKPQGIISPGMPIPPPQWP